MPDLRDIDLQRVAGQHSDGPVPMVRPDGALVQVENPAAALAAGYKPASDADVAKMDAHEKEKEQYSGTASELKAGAAGAARGLTFGASDWALTRSGAVDPRTLERLKE